MLAVNGTAAAAESEKFRFAVAPDSRFLLMECGRCGSADWTDQHNVRLLVERLGGTVATFAAAPIIACRLCGQVADGFDVQAALKRRKLDRGGG